MELAIVTNPHIKNPKKLWQALDQQEREAIGKNYQDEAFDPAGFERLKQTIQRHGGGIVVK